MNSGTSRVLVVVAMLLMVACATPVERAERYASQDEWMKAVLEYRKAYGKHPDNIEYKSRLQQTELKAADFYYQRGLRLQESGDLDAAIVQYQQGLVAMPDHAKLLQAMNEALARKEASGIYREGLKQLEANNTEEAKRRFEKALETYPNFKDAQAQLDAIRKRQQARATGGLALSSAAPVTLNFRQTDLRTAFEFLAKSFGVNVVFDESFKSVPVTLFAKDVTFEQGFSLLLNTSKTFYRRIGPNTVLVAPDTKEKRGQYEDQIVRTFQLNSVPAKEMADILKGVLTVKKMVVNDRLNTITIRDTEEVGRLVARLVDENDREPAEILFDVEILEVNRSKEEQLGLNFGTYQFTAAVTAAQTTTTSTSTLGGTTTTTSPSTTPGTVPLSGSIRDSIRKAATLTVPSVTLNFFKQDVDGKTLANPKIRVVSGKTAKIHIGDRVPLQSSTIVDATGQTRTTYDYKDIGVLLTVEPTINLDNSCNVKLTLEVSSLGANKGTATNPAFEIGTRKAETYMVLRDGETAILGGLIQETDSHTKQLIPGLGDIPVLGTLFTNYDDSGGRTDVLLTITPRVVRSWDVASQASREFYSGSESAYDDKPLFASLDVAAVTESGEALRPKIDTSATRPAPPAPPTGTVPTATPTPPTAPAAGQKAEAAAAPVPTAPAAGPPTLAFAQPAYEAASGQQFQVALVGQNLAGVTQLPIEILYNSQMLKYVSTQRGDPAPQSFAANADEGRGVVDLKIAYAPGAAPPDNATLGTLVLRGVKPGVSYLVYRVPAITGANGASLNAQVRASRIVIK